MAWQSLKTHCPRGHPYDDQNTRYTKQGYRQCRTCMTRTKALRENTGYYVKRYRDQECPICGLKWFVNASSHVRQAHGQKIPGLVSEDCRFMSLARFTDLGLFDYSPAAIRRRHRQWAKTILREQARGGEYVTELMRLWKVSRGGAEKRIKLVLDDGLIPPRPGRTHRTHCRKGHPYNEENAYLRSDGKYQCRVCKREAWLRRTPKT
jgi:hypothetical protein